MAGGILLVVFPLLGYVRLSIPLIGGMVVGLLLVPVAMVGFHALQRQRYGGVGIAGLCLVVISSLVVAFGVADYFVWGDFLQQAPPWWLGWGVVGLVIGFVLYGIATLQAKVLPRWCGVSFLVALPLALASSFPLPFVSTPILFGLAWLALGYALWARRGGPVEQQPRRVR